MRFARQASANLYSANFEQSFRFLSQSDWNGVQLFSQSIITKNAPPSSQLHFLDIEWLLRVVFSETCFRDNHSTLGDNFMSSKPGSGSSALLERKGAFAKILNIYVRGCVSVVFDCSILSWPNSHLRKLDWMDLVCFQPSPTAYINGPNVQITPLFIWNIVKSMLLPSYIGSSFSWKRVL